MSRTFRIVALALLLTLAANQTWAADRPASDSFFDSVVQVLESIFDGSEAGLLSDPDGDEVNLGPLGDPNGDEVPTGPNTSHQGDDPELGPIPLPWG